MDLSLRVIGYVRSSLTDLADCPKQEDENAPEAVIEFARDYGTGTHGLREGQRVIVFTWLHRSLDGGRETLRVHPRGNPDTPARGVFSTRSPRRPNPIGMHETTITAVEGDRLIRVAALEALSGTPVLDIKPALTVSPDNNADRVGTDATPTEHITKAATTLRMAARSAWERGLLAGFNGNLSIRPDYAEKTVYISGTGCAKGYLQTCDVAAIDLASGTHIAGAAPSSESPLHLCLYRALLPARAILHIHPVHMLAAAARFGAHNMLDVNLFEAAMYKDCLAVAPAITPGTSDLAEAVTQAALSDTSRRAVFMEQHGLVMWGTTLTECLALAEELEGICTVKLLAEG